VANSTPNPAEKPALPTLAASEAAFLAAIGSEVRRSRAKRGMTRRQLAQTSQTSERYLAQIESGTGNPSVSVLRAIAQALDLPCAALLPESGARTAALGAILDLLAQVPEGELPALAMDIETRLARPGSADRARRIALVGLRGAGKSTLGRMLAEDLGFPFVELSREIEKFAGCTVNEIQALYGQNAYRRYERRAIEEAIQIYPEAVIAAPGGMVSDAATFNLLLAHCTTLWLQAEPEDHMRRVAAQGDLRPMAGNREAMDDLKSILAGRAAFYSKAEFSFDTSAQPLAPTFLALRTLVRKALDLPVQTSSMNMHESA
jgi:XRE family transcriptional regulator, aerobic/anaerobic benzoate catabolism transcriptional regulator